MLCRASASARGVGGKSAVDTGASECRRRGQAPMTEVWADEFAKVCPEGDRGLMMVGRFANAPV